MSFGPSPSKGAMPGPVWHKEGWRRRFHRNQKNRENLVTPPEANQELEYHPQIAGPVNVHTHYHSHSHSATGARGRASMHRTRTFIRPVHVPEIAPNTVGFSSMINGEMALIDNTLDSLLARSQGVVRARAGAGAEGSTLQLRRAVNASVENQVKFFTSSMSELCGPCVSHKCGS